MVEANATSSRGPSLVASASTAPPPSRSGSGGSLSGAPGGPRGILSHTTLVGLCGQIRFSCPPQFDLGRVTSVAAGVHLELERVGPSGREVIPFFWASGGDFEAFERRVREEDLVEELTAVARFPDRVFRGVGVLSVVLRALAGIRSLRSLIKSLPHTTSAVVRATRTAVARSAVPREVRWRGFERGETVALATLGRCDSLVRIPRLLLILTSSAARRDAPLGCEYEECAGGDLNPGCDHGKVT